MINELVCLLVFQNINKKRAARGRGGRDVCIPEADLRSIIVEVEEEGGGGEVWQQH